MRPGPLAQRDIARLTQIGRAEDGDPRTLVTRQRHVRFIGRDSQLMGIGAGFHPRGLTPGGKIYPRKGIAELACYEQRTRGGGLGAVHRHRRATRQ